jgi:predicted small secreted protein
MKKLVALVCLIMVTGLLSACSNTANGAGKDIEGMGQWMQNTF